MATAALHAQQDPMFSQYAFNGLAYNPAYTGSANALSINALHRHQWWGTDGGAMTQYVGVHSPLRNQRVALGLQLLHDGIGESNQLSMYATYAYRMPLGASKKSTLSVGVQGGVDNWRADWTDLRLQDPTDVAFAATPMPNQWLPNFGLGMELSSKHYFIALSSPRILNNNLVRKGFNDSAVAAAVQYRHYYLAGGVALPLSAGVLFRPTFMIKNVGLFGVFGENRIKTTAPTEIDLDAALLLADRVWVGAGFRTAVSGQSSYDALKLHVGLQLSNGFRVRGGYDYTLTNMRNGMSGAYEVSLGYDFNYQTSKVVSNRYF